MGEQQRNRKLELTEEQVRLMERFDSEFRERLIRMYLYYIVLNNNVVYFLHDIDARNLYPTDEAMITVSTAVWK